MKRTYATKKSDIKTEWHLIDVEDKILGRVSTEIAGLLMGKNKVTFTSTMNVGDKIVVINSDKIAVTGKKLEDKLYHRHTGFPGGIKTLSLKQLLEKDSTRVVRKAVSGMLPKNKLRKHRLANLYIYPGKEHPHGGQIANDK